MIGKGTSGRDHAFLLFCAIDRTRARVQKKYSEISASKRKVSSRRSSIPRSCTEDLLLLVIKHYKTLNFDEKSLLSFACRSIWMRYQNFEARQAGLAHGKKADFM